MTLFWSLGWFHSNKLDNPSFQKFQILVLISLFQTFEYLCSVLKLILVNKCFKTLTWFFKINICFKTNFLSIYPCTLWWFIVSLKPPTFKYIGNNFSFLLFMFLDSLRSYFVRSENNSSWFIQGLLNLKFDPLRYLQCLIFPSDQGSPLTHSFLFV